MGKTPTKQVKGQQALSQYFAPSPDGGAKKSKMTRKATTTTSSSTGKSEQDDNDDKTKKTRKNRSKPTATPPPAQKRAKREETVEEEKKDDFEPEEVEVEETAVTQSGPKYPLGTQVCKVRYHVKQSVKYCTC